MTPKLSELLPQRLVQNVRAGTLSHWNVRAIDAIAVEPVRNHRVKAHVE